MQKIHKKALAQILAHRSNITIQTISAEFIDNNSARNFLKWCHRKNLLSLDPITFNFFVTDDDMERILELLNGQTKLAK